MPIPPFEHFNDAAAAGPVVVSVPHAGRDYGSLASQLRVPLADVFPLEDRLVDRLIEPAVRSGQSAIIARAPRLLIDLNRAPDELDPAMIAGMPAQGVPLSVKVRGGLGLVPARLNGRTLWRARLDPRDVERRMANVHAPFHAMLASMVAAARARWGVALLIDLHSMPPLGTDDAPDIVIGDRFGRSAPSRLADMVVAHFERAGLRVACNAPYAGGYIIEHHAAPEHCRYALQIEISRPLYLNHALTEAGAGLPVMQSLLASLVAMLTRELAPPCAAAAE